MTSLPLTPRNQARREAVIDAAEALLAEGGPQALTLEAVAQRADVVVQTVYNRVGGRTALLIAVAERALADNRRYMDEVYATPGTTALERLVLATRAYARFAVERPHQFRLMADPPDEHGGALDRITAMATEQIARVAAVLAEGITEGTINPDLDPDATATTLWAVMNGILALTWRIDRHRAGPEELERMMASCAAMLTGGLVTPEAGAALTDVASGVWPEAERS